MLCLSFSTSPLYQQLQQKAIIVYSMHLSEQQMYFQAKGLHFSPMEALRLKLFLEDKELSKDRLPDLKHF